jgi:hydroxymethylglutaryl-CoA lyase
LKINNLIQIEEQGTRDGFQVETLQIPTEYKIKWIEQAVEAGVKRIQMTSFVHPKLVPQMADAEAVCKGVRKKEGVIYSGLVLNVKGVERAIKSGLNHIAISMSASNTHSQKNANKSIEESLIEFAEMARVAKEAGLKVRGGIQCAFGCRYEGEISEQFVIELAKRHIDLGIDELSLADSTGMGNPVQMKRIMSQIVPLAGNLPVILHLHDTEGKGIANMIAAIETGVNYFDTAFGGLGGCPFIKGATGNIATEDVVHCLHQMGYETGINNLKMIELAKEVEVFLGRKLPGKIKDLSNYQ